MDCSSEDTQGSNSANWMYRDPRTLSLLSSPAKDYSASSIVEGESHLSEAQDNDEHVQSGGVAMEAGDLKAVQPVHHWLKSMLSIWPD
ncbi:unnamed protein product [Gadus morhua 'NCC']